MGFKATEAVEELTYDFRPHVEAHGTIPEPSSKQIEDYRNTIVGSVKAAGLDPAALEGGKVTMENMDTLLEAASGVEEATLAATAGLTGIPLSTLSSLPYRIKAAFLGWIMGQFFNPEA